jgi:thiamine-phosphate pyrophosphorylase
VSVAGLVVVTDRRQASAPLPELVAGAVDGGARWVLLREKDLPRPERAELAARLREVLTPAGGRLIVAGPNPLGGDAVHLSAADPLVRAGLVGRSCHDPAELARLATEDYVTLSPVFASPSKPGYEPMGLDRFKQLCATAGRPVLALGGIETPAQAAACLEAGAAGIAVMGAVMRAPDVRAFIAALATTTALSPRTGSYR